MLFKNKTKNNAQENTINHRVYILKQQKRFVFSLFQITESAAAHNPMSVLNHVTSKVKNTDDRTFYTVCFRRVHLWEGTKRSNLSPATERRQPTKCGVLRY